MNKEKFQIYVVSAFIVLFVLFLIYYVFTASNFVKVNKVNIISIGKTASSDHYPLNFNVTTNFNSSVNQLYLSIRVKNNGNQTIGYNSGCISPFEGNVSPTSIANIKYVKGVATCGVITISPLKPNETVYFTWPYYPQIINITNNGEFTVNLTFPFGFYKNMYLPCQINTTFCNSTFYSFGGFTERDILNIKLLASG